MLEIADQAPVPLREPVRGLLWLTGWITALDGKEARDEILAVADVRPDHRLLDAGHGASVLQAHTRVDGDRGRRGHVVDQAGTVRERDAGPVLRQRGPLAAAPGGRAPRRRRPARPPSAGGAAGGHVRPLGLDRFGLRLRVEAECDDHDVRIAFSKPVSTPQELAAELRRLMGCPFLSQR